MRRNVPSRAQVQCWTVPRTNPTPVPQGEPERPTRHDPLHGYTLADIDHLTRLVLRMDRWYIAGDVDERFDAIRHAIVEILLTSDNAPDRKTLLATGTGASDRAVYGDARTHGRDVTHGSSPMPAFHRYWESAPHRGASPESRVVETVALTQIWPLLRPSEQRALTALAATGDYEQAAAACGVPCNTFRVLVSSGRRRFFESWHEGESPAGVWRTDRRVRSRDGRDHLGRARLNAAQVEAYRDRYARGETIRELAAEAGMSSTGLSRLLRGLSKPAEVRVS